MKTRFGFDDWIFNRIIAVFAEFKNVEKAVIFGSRAGLNYKNYSDIDIAVFGKNLSRDEFVKLCDKIDSLDLVYKTDVVHFEILQNQDLKEKILRDGVVVFTATDIC
jgi:predicted nucleotidyltransferase